MQSPQVCDALDFFKSFPVLYKFFPSDDTSNSVNATNSVAFYVSREHHEYLYAYNGQCMCRIALREFGLSIVKYLPKFSNDFIWIPKDIWRAAQKATTVDFGEFGAAFEEHILRLYGRTSSEFVSKLNLDPKHINTAGYINTYTQAGEYTLNMSITESAFQKTFTIMSDTVYAHGWEDMDTLPYSMARVLKYFKAFPKMELDRWRCTHDLIFFQATYNGHLVEFAMNRDTLTPLAIHKS